MMMMHHQLVGETLPLICITCSLSDNPPPTVDDGRATLMEAIRKAGGTEKAGLKSAKERKRRRKAKKEEEDQVPAATGGDGGDLLGDLHAALSRRRKGISGRQDKDELPNTGKYI